MQPVVSPFRWRSFVSVAVLLSFLLVLASGVALFARPEGSLARWVGWSLLGADKKQWESLHNATVLLFAVLSAIHLYLNWRSLVTYLRRQGSAWPRREFVAGLFLVALVSVGAVIGSQPFSALMDFRGSIKDGRFVVRTPPPALDADKLSVREVCERADLTPSEATANASARGVAISDPSKTLGAVAKELRLTPEEVFEALRGTHDVRP